MNWRRMALAAGAGLVAFVLLMLARVIIDIIAVASLSLSLFGFTSSPTPGQLLILYVVVPAIIWGGAALPAWALGARRWRCLLAGLLALVVAAYVISLGRANYSPFNRYETLAFVSAALAAVAVAVARREETGARGMAAWLSAAMVVTGLAFLLPAYGFLVALLAWLLTPGAAGLFQAPRAAEAP